MENSDTYTDMGYMFSGCQELKEVPAMNYAYPYHVRNFFEDCRNLRQLPEDFGSNWNWTRLQTYNYSYFTFFFYNCYSLRKIPAGLLSKFYGVQSSTSYAPTSSTFSGCYSLDEVRNFPIHQKALTNNIFTGFINNCNRLKTLTFKTNADGTPYTANWKNQTIDFTSAPVGYASTTTVSNILDYNSGITAAKQVKDDATYQALKNDPDWFTTDIGYSRYNHDSAVETINSLPDCSSSGGTNTIRFKGAAGSKTDGGAINTMTDAEIAVAAAKGWTVSFA